MCPRVGFKCYAYGGCPTTWLFQCGDGLYTSESDVYGRHILKSKVLIQQHDCLYAIEIDISRIVLKTPP